MATAMTLTAPVQAASPLADAQLLDCAVFMAAALGTTADKAAEQGIGYYLSWLIGRYEGTTGGAIDADLSNRAVKISSAELEKLQPLCAADMSAFGVRMTELGASITDRAKQQAAKSK